jgi:hypothetical protein
MGNNLHALSFNQRYGPVSFRSDVRPRSSAAGVSRCDSTGAKKGVGAYNCGQIVSGYDPTLTSFTSTLRGDNLELNSVGKLCDCGPGRKDAHQNN